MLFASFLCLLKVVQLREISFAICNSELEIWLSNSVFILLIVTVKILKYIKSYGLIWDGINYYLHTGSTIQNFLRAPSQAHCSQVSGTLKTVPKGTPASLFSTQTGSWTLELAAGSV